MREAVQQGLGSRTPRNGKVGNGQLPEKSARAGKTDGGRDAEREKYRRDPAQPAFPYRGIARRRPNMYCKASIPESSVMS